MKNAWLSRRLRVVIDAAASLTGKRFNLLVASSIVATAAIIAAAASAGGKDMEPLAELVGRRLAAEQTPATAAATPEPTPGPQPAPKLEPQPLPEPAPEIEAGPVIESAPEPAPVEEAARPEPEPEAEPEPAPEGEETAPTEEAPKPEAGRIKHVFVVSLASPGYDAAWSPKDSQMPYLSGTLRPEGDLLTGFTLLDEGWLPNSFAALAGQTPTPDSERDCPDYEACVFPVETLSYVDQLGTAQFTWGGYFEGMADETGKPANCVHPEPGAEDEPAPGGYAAKLNPFVYFHTLLDLGECAANDKPLTELEVDLRKPDTTPSFSYVSPDLCDAGVPGQCEPGTPEGAAAADAWLSTWIPKILKSPAYEADGLLVVTFGSVSPVPNPDPAQPPTPPTSLKTGTLLVSHFLQPGATDGARYDPYSLLATNEDLFGLGRLGEAGAKKVKSLAPALLGEGAGD